MGGASAGRGGTGLCRGRRREQRLSGWRLRAAAGRAGSRCVPPRVRARGLLEARAAPGAVTVSGGIVTRSRARHRAGRGLTHRGRLSACSAQPLRRLESVAARRLQREVREASNYRPGLSSNRTNQLPPKLSRIDFVKELTTFGFPSLYEEPKSPETKRELNVVAVLNCMNELLVLQRKNLLAQESVETQNLKLGSDMGHLQSCYTKLKEQLETSRREMIGLQERDRQLQCKNRNLHQLLKNEKDEVQKLQNIIASRATQYNHDMKRKEREYNKLKERLHQLVMNKKDKKIAMDVLNYVGRADGKRGSWRTDKTEARNEDEMYKILLNDYECRQKQILLENAELKKVLQQMKKEMISLLSPQKKKPRERVDDSTSAA
ncbi:hypothetical protein STEG23_007076, partial [Scotinomys teguina]